MPLRRCPSFRHPSLPSLSESTMYPHCACQPAPEPCPPGPSLLVSILPSPLSLPVSLQLLCPGRQPLAYDTVWEGARLLTLLCICPKGRGPSPPRPQGRAVIFEPLTSMGLALHPHFSSGSPDRPSLATPSGKCGLPCVPKDPAANPHQLLQCAGLLGELARLEPPECPSSFGGHCP